MNHQSDSDLLTRRLEAILLERSEIRRRDDELSADEQRIRLALEVIKALRASNEEAVDVYPPNLRGTGGITTLTAASASRPVSAQPKQRLEDLILQALGTKDGLTSLEVVSSVGTERGAKRESVVSTLSRMASKGKVRREGRLYFVGKKGESPRVVATTGLSVATESVAGQHTPGALIGGKGEENL